VEVESNKYHFDIIGKLASSQNSLVQQPGARPRTAEPENRLQQAADTSLGGVNLHFVDANKDLHDAQRHASNDNSKRKDIFDFNQGGLLAGADHCFANYATLTAGYA
jgi:hypothetical protein